MIMKRKLPSQMDKPEEKLDTTSTEAEQQTAATQTEQNKPAETAGVPARTEQPAASAPQDDLNTVDDEKLSSTTTADDFESAPAPTPTKEDAEADYSENDVKFDLSDSPFSMPEDIPDPFVSGSFGEDDMVMDAPASRPQETKDDSFGAPTPMPPKKTVSTEALVDKPHNDTDPSAPSPAQKANPSSADVLMDDEGYMDAPVQNPSASANTAPADDNWDLGDLVDIPTGNQSASSVLDEEPQGSPFDSSPKVDSPKSPPWKSGSKSGKKGGRTLLPGQQVPSNSGGGNGGGSSDGSKLGGLISIAVLLALVVGTAVFYQNRDGVIESISRWTGTLNDVSQEVPAAPEMAEATPDNGSSFNAEPAFETPEPAPNDMAETEDDLGPNLAQAPGEPAPSTTRVEVLDVMPEEADEPIVADESTELPEDVDRFAALQEAIERKRAERRQKTSAKLEDEDKDLDPRTLPPEVVTKRNNDIIKETNKALNEYKKALAEVGNPALKPRPGDFFGGRQGENGQLSPPTTNNNTAPQQQQAEPLKTYGNPIIEDPAELVTRQIEQDDGIRKLEDFNLTMFEPKEDRIRIPEYVAPSLSASEFPPLEVLSFVPDYGIIGLNRGSEGVLLIGESLEGWELVGVYDAYAEFRKGELNKIVTIKDANR